MKRLLTHVAALLCTLGTMAQAEMSPLIRELAWPQVAPEPAASAPRHAAPAADAPATGRRVCAFVEISGPADSILTACDCQLLAREGNISIATIPQNRLLALAATPGVSRIEAARSCHLTMDTTCIVTGATSAHEGKELPQAFDGTGVMLGLMDVGFDLTHPNFLNNDNTDCRIRRFWDMLAPRRTGSSLPVGSDYDIVYNPSRGMPNIPHSADGTLMTHGTHTLGIAAGSGFGSPYKGIAPASDICIVANAVMQDTVFIAPEDRDLYTNATDALGFKYIFDYADSVGRPCVISFSEGYYPSFTNEDRLFCSFIDALLGPGHLLVTAAGNESVRASTIHKPVGQSRAGAFVYDGDQFFSFYTRTRGNFLLNLYFYDRETLVPLDTLAINPASIPGNKSPDMYPNAPYRNAIRVKNGNFTLSMWKYVSALDARDTICYAQLRCQEGFLKAPRLAVVITAERTTEADVWGQGSAFRNQANWNDAVVRSNVLMPGLMRRIITVGNTEHRTGIVNYLGEQKTYSTCEFPGGINYASSVGPTYDGRIKPDVCAPGTNIISSYSSYYLENHPDATDITWDVEHFDHNGRTYVWNSNSGTSMSCPVVAGVLAVWLQAQPSLSPDDVLDVLAHTCRQPDPSLSYPNNTYGYGDIDAYRGLLYLLGLDAINGISLAQPAGATVRPTSSGALHVVFASQPARAVTLRLYSTAGQLLHSQLLPPGTTDATVSLPRLQPGIYAVQLNGPDAATTGSTLIRF